MKTPDQITIITVLYYKINVWPITTANIFEENSVHKNKYNQ